MEIKILTTRIPKDLWIQARRLVAQGHHVRPATCRREDRQQSTDGAQLRMAGRCGEGRSQEDQRHAECRYQSPCAMTDAMLRHPRDRGDGSPQAQA